MGNGVALTLYYPLVMRRAHMGGEPHRRHPQICRAAMFVTAAIADEQAPMGPGLQAAHCGFIDERGQCGRRIYNATSLTSNNSASGERGHAATSAAEALQTNARRWSALRKRASVPIGTGLHKAQSKCR